MKSIKAIARIRAQRDVDLTLKTLKLKFLGQPYDEVLLTTDRRYKRYTAIEDRTILEDGLMFLK